MCIDDTFVTLLLPQRGKYWLVGSDVSSKVLVLCKVRAHVQDVMRCLRNVCILVFDGAK